LGGIKRLPHSKLRLFMANNFQKPNERKTAAKTTPKNMDDSDPWAQDITHKMTKGQG